MEEDPVAGRQYLTVREIRRIQMGERGQPLGVVLHLEHVGPAELRAPRTTVALLDERALCADLAGPLGGRAPICFTCGGSTTLLDPSQKHPLYQVYRCTNPRCGATFRDVAIMGGLCDHAEVWVGPILHGKRAPRSGLLVEAWGVAKCYICDERTLYHWTRTSAGSQLTLIEWKGSTRRSLTRDAAALIINK